jgi:hypothetical protein
MTLGKYCFVKRRLGQSFGGPINSVLLARVYVLSVVMSPFSPHGIVITGARPCVIPMLCRSSCDLVFSASKLVPARRRHPVSVTTVARRFPSPLPFLHSPAIPHALFWQLVPVREHIGQRTETVSNA